MVWKDMCNHVSSAFWLSSNLRRHLGNGENTLFWHSMWMPLGCPVDVADRLYSIASDKQSTVAAKVCTESEELTWLWHWRRLLSQDQTSLAASWGRGLPRRVQAFVWRLIQERIATFDNLQSRGVLTAQRPAPGKYADTGDAREMGFKRQRIMDQGPSYYSTPAPPSYLYNALPPPPPAYSYIPPPFPVVRLRGLPFDCAETEIVDFFHGLDVIDVLFVRKGGKFKGEAYCVLGYPLQIDFALQRNRQNIGRRYVEVFRSRKEEYYKAIANELFDAPGGSPRRGAPRARSADETRDLSEFKGLLRLRGLPFSATREEIMNFFDDFELSEDKIHLIANSEGRPAGEAIVEFASPEESRAAMSKDRMTLGYRYIELFPASREELEDAATRGRLLPKSFEGKEQTEPVTPVLRMRGLPFSAGKDDIIDFFKDFTLPEESIHIIFNFEGRPTGEAFVEFASAEDAKAALAKDRMTLGSRYIELFPSSNEDLNEVSSRGR